MSRFEGGDIALLSALSLHASSLSRASRRFVVFIVASVHLDFATPVAFVAVIFPDLKLLLQWQRCTVCAPDLAPRDAIPVPFCSEEIQFPSRLEMSLHFRGCNSEVDRPAQYHVGASGALLSERAQEDTAHLCTYVSTVVIVRGAQP